MPLCTQKEVFFASAELRVSFFAMSILANACLAAPCLGRLPHASLASTYPLAFIYSAAVPRKVLSDMFASYIVALCVSKAGILNQISKEMNGSALKSPFDVSTYSFCIPITPGKLCLQAFTSCITQDSVVKYVKSLIASYHNLKIPAVKCIYSIILIISALCTISFAGTLQPDSRFSLTSHYYL